MTIFLLDDTLQIDIFYECEDQEFEDNICVSIVERCPANERLLRAGKTHVFLTPEQAQRLGEALLAAVQHSHVHDP